MVKRVGVISQYKHKLSGNFVVVSEKGVRFAYDSSK
jgi:hypothetical protein